MVGRATVMEEVRYGTKNEAMVAVASTIPCSVALFIW